MGKVYKKTTNDPTGWWYYFEKANNGETNKCKKCGWEQLRDKFSSTTGLKYHLETIHPELNSKRLEEIRIKERKKKGNNNNMNVENLNPFITFGVRARESQEQSGEENQGREEIVAKQTETSIL
jgi:hypothetical protein